ncbi:MAG TPA: exosortase/archaeosortase family protein [Verrucomicrobiae bacterium]|nr:exosortase/archaeosortase family protein [Verrucomicrobiae bacterium]
MRTTTTPETAAAAPEATLPPAAPPKDEATPGLALSFLPAVLAGAWLIAKTSWFWSHNPDLQFGWIVVMLCGYLLWEAWEHRPPVRLRLEWPAVALMAVAFPGLFLVQIYQAAFGTTAASVNVLAAAVMAVIAANVHYVFGLAGVRRFAFGCLFLWIALPMPSAIYNPLVGSLQSWVADINVEVLRLLGVPAEKLGSLIRLPHCVVGVDEACSGIRSLQSTIMATLFIGALTLKRAGLRIFLLVAGAALAVLGNVIRSLFLSLTAHSRGPEALKAYHDTAGWSILVFTVAGVAVLAWLFGRLEARLTSFRLEESPSVPSTLV